MRLSEITKSLEEEFGTISSRTDHFDRHVNMTGEATPEIAKQFIGARSFTYKEVPDEETYEQLADRAARRPLEKSVILGYISADRRCQKYNKKTEEFVSYTVDSSGNPVIVTYFPMSLQGWNLNKQRGPHKYMTTLTSEKDAKPL